MHPIKNKQQKIIRWVAITKIVSSTTIQDWKNNDQFYAPMTEAKTYLFPHPFDESDWNIVGIGFIKNIHAVHYPKDLLQEQIVQLIESQNTTSPLFQLIPQRITTTDKSASTKAYTVQCHKNDAEELIHLLTHGPFRNEPNQIFVPFKYKKTKPDTFLKCIRRQNEVYYKTWIIKLEGITHDTMAYIEKDINSIMGVWHLVPSKRVHEIGEWKVLTDQSKCAYIHRQLSAAWPQILAKVPQQTLEAAPSHFSTPMISSKRAREYQDNESDGDSYGSLLTTGTEISAMTAEDATLNELPDEYQYPTYAAAAAAGSTPSVVDTQMSSPTNSTAYSEWIKEKQELEAQIKLQAQQIEKIQADLQAKISRSQDLEEQLAQAIELAHTRDARHEKMLDKFEQLMHSQSGGYNHQSYSGYGNHDAMLPATPERPQPKLDSPPPKKANTNTSPHRHIYALFRQPNNRSGNNRQTTNSRNAAHKKAATTVSNSMEVDGDTHQPTPGVKMGQQQE